MAIKSLKDKISNLASGEILGETDKEKEVRASKERSPKVRKERPKKEKVSKHKEEKAVKPKKEKELKEKRTKKPKKTKQPKQNFMRRKEVEHEEPEVEMKESPKKTKEEPIVKESIEGYEDVLSILGIKENLNPEVDFMSSDLDYIEFNQTTPLGFDFQEVTDFISRVKYTLNKYESALSQRNKDLIIVASEVKKVEERMVEASQAKELERMVGGMTEEELLIEENLDLSIQLNELKNKLIANGRDGDISQLRRQVEMLQSENEMLKSGIFPADDSEDNSGLPSLGESKSSTIKSIPDKERSFGEMPNLDESEGAMPNLSEIGDENEDPLDDMISDLGGIYNDEEGWTK